MTEKKPPFSLNEELFQTEKKLLHLIQKRTRLLSKIARNRFEQEKSPVDTFLEKKLWALWKSTLKGENQRFFRQIFSTLNNTSYLKAESKQYDKPFCLYPSSSRAINFQTEAPLSNFQARINLILAVLSNTETHIDPFPINDPLVELIKVLNQAGARISWQSNSLHTGPAPLFFEDKALFLGEDEFNFYLVLALSITQAGSCKLNGASQLKMLNLKALQDFLPHLGARLTSIEPQSYNLPARLECSGHLPTEIVFPNNLSEKFALALAFTPFLTQKPLTIIFDNPLLKLEELKAIFNKWNLLLEIKENSLHIAPQTIKSPATLSIEADTILSSYLLLLPYILGGKVELEGSWPEYTWEAKLLGQIFTELGLNFTPNPISTSKEKSYLEELSLDIRNQKDFLPLSLAIAIFSQNRSVIYHQLTEEELEPAIDLLNFLNISYNYHPEYLELNLSEQKTFKKEKEKVWTSPSPLWTLSYALISFKYKGICLSNPAIITQIWPRFWKIFQSLPLGQVETKEEVKNEQNNTKRRIRIR